MSVVNKGSTQHEAFYRQHHFKCVNYCERASKMTGGIPGADWAYFCNYLLANTAKAHCIRHATWQLAQLNTHAVNQVSVTKSFLHFSACMSVLVEYSRKAAQPIASFTACCSVQQWIYSRGKEAEGAVWQEMLLVLFKKCTKVSVYL